MPYIYIYAIYIYIYIYFNRIWQLITHIGCYAIKHNQTKPNQEM